MNTSIRCIFFVGIALLIIPLLGVRSDTKTILTMIAGGVVFVQAIRMHMLMRLSSGGTTGTKNHTRLFKSPSSGPNTKKELIYDDDESGGQDNSNDERSAQRNKNLSEIHSIKDGTTKNDSRKDDPDDLTPYMSQHKQRAQHKPTPAIARPATYSQANEDHRPFTI